MFLSYPPVLHDISYTPMARYSLFVLKVLVNTSEPTKQVDQEDKDLKLVLKESLRKGTRVNITGSG